MRTDFEAACMAIVGSATTALAATGRSVELADVPVVIGVAGIDSAAGRSRLIAALPFARVAVGSDAQTALAGALGESDGAIAILGTGSIFIARWSAVQRRIGGYGHELSDHGSGVRIGKALLERALLAHDGAAPRSPLLDETLNRFDGQPSGLISLAATSPRDVAALAPAVFAAADRGDVAGMEIVEEAVRGVERSLAALAIPDDGPLCLLGGLAAAYAPRLSPRYRRMLRSPKADAAAGAAGLARGLFAGNAGPGSSGLEIPL
jgi:glucosamine kinase